LRALARWIEYDGVEIVECFRYQWILEQIELFHLDRFEAGGCCGGAFKRGQRWFVVVCGKDAGVLGEPQCERTNAGK
jgi:hypothetical protein